MAKKAYKYRFYPTKEQRELLEQTFGCCRFVYNYMLRWRMDGWYEGKRRSYLDSSKQLTLIKRQPEFLWLNAVSSVPLQQSLRYLQRAYVNFFEHRSEEPVFKKKYDQQSATYVKTAFRWESRTKTLTVAKLGRLRIRWSRYFDVEPTSITITKDRSGRYFVSFHVEEEIDSWKKTKQVVGIDLGCLEYIVTSEGQHVSHPKYLRKYRQRLRQLQKKLSRQQRKGQNWIKTKLKIAKVYAKIADCRNDFLHNLSTELVRDYDTICFESLAVKNMMARPKPKRDENGRYLPNGRSRKKGLNRSIADSSWSKFTGYVEYKAEWYGKQIVKIDRFFPSSKRCHCCGYTMESLPLHIRQWTCPECDVTHDRDENAAKNILAVGQTVSVYGQSVRPAKVSTGGGNFFA